MPAIQSGSKGIRTIIEYQVNELQVGVNSQRTIGESDNYSDDTWSSLKVA